MLPTIFIVDDDPAARESVSMLARANGMESRGYPSAESFLNAYLPDQPGCLVLDIRMGGMSGLELQEHLNSQGVRVPIIFTSGYVTISSAVKAMESGAVTVLEKPYNHNELWSKIQQALVQDAQARRIENSLNRIQDNLKKLSSQERQILELIVAGDLNKNIARKLTIGLRTVERDRANIFLKMEVNSVAQLVEKVLSLRASQGVK